MNIIRLPILLFGVLIVWPATAQACEPIVPLVQLFGGPNLFSRTFFWMLGSVAVKCIAFVCFERNLRWYEAIGFMVLANLLSTLAGILVAMPFIIPLFALGSLPFALMLCAIPARRLAAQPIWPALRLKSASQFAGLIFCALLTTSVLWNISISIKDRHEFTLYWVVKYVYVVIALFVSIVLTSIWEEWAVARLAKSAHGEKSFMKSVLRANYVTFAVVVTATAIQMLPKRLNSPGFLAWLRELSVAIGFSA